MTQKKNYILAYNVFDQIPLRLFPENLVIFEFHRIPTMKLRRILGSISSLATNKLSSSSSSSSSYRQIFTARSSSLHRDAGTKHFEALPGNHIKWASLGSVRNSQFASGFTPLQQKPLDSIMDLERAKTKSPEELTSIWDDVIYKPSLLSKFVFFVF